MEKILIIGANGFIGTHLTNIFKEKASEYKIELFEQDVLKTNWSKYMSESRPDYLVNLAWRTGKGYLDSYENIQFVKAGIDMYDAFYNNNGKRAVYLGTEQEYEYSIHPLKETDLINPVSLYAECKASLGKILVKNSIIQNRGFVWGRLFFVYGEGEKPERLMPYMISNMLEGNDITCSYNKYVRDYIYVKDVASAIYTCLFAEYTGYVNIGGGEMTTIEKIAETIKKITSSSSEIKFRTKEECNQNPCSCADISLLRSLGWEKKYNLYDGLSEEIEMMKKD